MKLLLDMNISPQWVGFLTAAGFECAHWSTTGTPDASDRDIFAFALANEYVLLTHDLDFSAMHRGDARRQTECSADSCRRSERVRYWKVSGDSIDANAFRTRSRRVADH